MTYKKYKKDCHDGPTILLISRGLELAGASRNEAEDSFYDYDLVISLESCVPTKTRIVSGKVRSVGLGRILERYDPTEHIRIMWPDMGVPLLDKGFWLDLSNVLKKKGRDRERFDGKYRVMVHCMGGHGRTGTALAILANMCTEEGWNGEDLLEKVRRFYCPKSIEAEKQIKYIEKITGVKVKGSVGTKTSINLNSFDYDTSFKKNGNKKYIEEVDYNRFPSSDLRREVVDEPLVETRFNTFKAITQEEKDEKERIKRGGCTLTEHCISIIDLGYCPKCGEISKEYDEILDKKG